MYYPWIAPYMLWKNKNEHSGAVINLTPFNPARAARQIMSRARILKDLMEAEKSTFRGELSFQRS
jgi:hypothetical protein